MSVSRGCVVVERNPGQWFCAVAQEEYDDDFNSYSVYGPKTTFGDAYEEMRKHECNPGGYTKIGYDALTPAMINLIDNGLTPI